VATPADALGPFYKPGAPVRDRVGTGFVLSGAVLAVGTCRPVAGVVLEFWLANPQGNYDDQHRATWPVGSGGTYRLETNVPVPYAGRPPHIHIRVKAPDREAFVTQFYPKPGQTSATFDLVIPV
jgi:protocatechuate 3,4-dioxygenase beta subunit